MNIQKHKSVAVRKEDHETLTALCGKEHRGPAQYMSLLIKKEIERRARLKKMTIKITLYLRNFMKYF